MYGDSARWDDFSNFGQTSNLSSDDNNNNNDEFFEFFSEDFTASTRSTSTNKNIIFCGKLIPQKEHPPMETNNMKQQFSGNNIKKGVSQSTRKLDFSVGKVSVLKSSTKSRWYLFLFGMSKFPTEMELRNMKSRQSRRGPPAMTIVPSSKKDGEVVKGTRPPEGTEREGFLGNL
ncbi:Protein unc-13 4B like [Quillaja saponaria]|uniref:Protein unc-13 4B like n=1 Tax=Quillaja saponaria TaxID=32244 RepID=A0AAD7Q580_QUISA|nr:Protein unc-13 4B like [Quillaja saponaria]